MQGAVRHGNLSYFRRVPKIVDPGSLELISIFFNNIDFVIRQKVIHDL